MNNNTTTASEVSEKKSYYLGDNETISLASEKELHDYVDYREETDRWLHPLAMQLSVIGIPCMRAWFARAIEKVGDKLKDVTDEEIEQTVQEYGFFVQFPNEDSNEEVRPLRWTALDSLLGRAGIDGSRLRRTKPSAKKEVMPPEIKASMITGSLIYNSETTSLLVRDGKVTNIGSEKYQVLSAKKGIDTLEGYLGTTHPKFAYQTGMVSHEYLVADYLINDDEMEQSFMFAMQQAGIDQIKEVKAGIRFTTSNVGTSKMRARLFLVINGSDVMFGKAIGEAHETGSSIEGFGSKLPQVDALFSEAEEKVEELGNTPIQFPGSCFRYMAEKAGFSATFSAKKAEDISAKYSSATAIDIYLELNASIEEALAGKKTAKNFVTFSENVASLLFVDFKAFDKPYVEMKK